MRINLYHFAIALVCLLWIAFIPVCTYGQNKSAPAKTQQKKSPSVKPEETVKASSIPEDQMEVYRGQAGQIIQFLASTLNFLADKSNTVKEKETIINDSYNKFFRDDEVQIEDDLDEKRLVPLYKDVQAYLSDVDFFFKTANFDYQVQDVSVMTNPEGLTYFRVTANRTLQGITVSGDSVNSNKVRYIEINYDENQKQLQIVSIYTTKPNEKEDLRIWWNGLSDGWKEILGGSFMVEPGVPLSKVANYNDTVAMIDGFPVEITDSRLYGMFLKIIDSREIDLSNNLLISNLDPLSKLSGLVKINLSNTPVNDLMPLRNLNALEDLNISGTQVISLEPLKYSNNINVLSIGKTQVTDISQIALYTNLHFLDLGYTDISSLDPLKDLTGLRQLFINNTSVVDLTPLSGLKNLEVLDCSGTPVVSLEPLKGLEKLKTLSFNNTGVKSLEPLEKLVSVEKVYCDHTLVGKDKAVDFMLAHPGVVVSFASGELGDWWKAMPPDWQKVFFLSRNLDPNPTLEQLHSLLTIDSINVNGRMEIAALTPLKELTRMRWLDCSNTSVSSLDALRALLNMSYIDAHNTGITDVKPIAGMVRMEYLNIDNTGVEDLDPLLLLPALNLILADNTKVSRQEASDFMDKNPNCMVISQTFENSSWWKGLSKEWQGELMKQLNLRSEPDKFQLQMIAGLNTITIKENPSINSLQPVVFLRKLDTLTFSDTRVTSLEPLAGMTWLKSLNFPKNAIFDLTPISGLTGLTELNFENTQVEDLSPIENLRNLEVIRLSGTPVRNLKSLEGMMKLRVVDLYNTRISSLSPLDNKPSLQSVKIFNAKVPSRKADEFKAKHPACEVVYY